MPSTKEMFKNTEKGPIPHRDKDIVKVEVDYHPEEPTEKEIPCGCKEGKVLRWTKFNHTVYTLGGNQIEIQDLSGYKCNNCSLVLLEPDAAEPIDLAIRSALQSIDVDLDV
jgi:YgiT-type zinc finger domain-containing protein